MSRARSFISFSCSGLALASLLSGCEPPPALLPLPPPRVEVMQVALSDSSRELRLSGTLEAERTVSLSFATLGTVQQVLVQEGEAVTRGQPLARLSPGSYQDAVGMAQAKVSQAEDAYRRLEPMHKNQTIPDIKWVEVDTGQQEARLALSLAQKSLTDTVLRAPEAGIVARRIVEPGMNAAPGVPAFLLVQTQTVVATAPLPEIHVAKIHKGDPVQVSVSALGKSYQTTVRDLGVMADPLTRTYRLRAAIPNPEGELRLGMVAQLRLRLPGEGQSLVVPPAAVRVDEQGRPCVFVVNKEQRLERRRVEVAGFVGEGTAISRGLAPGERVVTSGTPMLADGIAVHVAGERAEAE
jgi:membrane fusion protein, multidrug efflux system